MVRKVYLYPHLKQIYCCREGLGILKTKLREIMLLCLVVLGWWAALQLLRLAMFLDTEKHCAKWLHCVLHPHAPPHRFTHTASTRPDMNWFGHPTWILSDPLSHPSIAHGTIHIILFISWLPNLSSIRLSHIILFLHISHNLCSSHFHQLLLALFLWESRWNCFCMRQVDFLVNPSTGIFLVESLCSFSMLCICTSTLFLL